MAPAGLRRAAVRGGLCGLLVVCASTGSYGASPVTEAVRRGDREGVQRLIAEGASVNAGEPDGTTPLHIAAHYDAVETVRTLLEAGARAEVANRLGVTPLALAATNGSAAIVTLLLEAGASPHTAAPSGETPLMLAARAGSVPAVTTLMRAGADVDVAESSRAQTALMWAAAEGHADVVDVLLDGGADLRVRSRGGWTALLFAVREGRSEVVRVLIARGAAAEDVLKGGASPGEAASGADEGPVRGPSALALAVSNGHFELATLLLELGADPNGAQQGWTPLHELSWVRRPGTGSNNPAPSGSGGMTSLELVDRLLDAGADVNARASVGRREAVMTQLNLAGGTPFLFAARTCDVELMQKLVSRGADPLAANEDGTTPLMVAAGVGTRSPGEDAGAEPDCVAAVNMTLELGNDIDAVDRNANTAMHGAAYKQLPDVVELLAAKGAAIGVWNTKNASGWTPLRIAAGVYRASNFRFSEPTAKALRQVMADAGVSTELEDAESLAGASRKKGR